MIDKKKTIHGADHFSTGGETPLPSPNINLSPTEKQLGDILMDRYELKKRLGE